MNKTKKILYVFMLLSLLSNIYSVTTANNPTIITRKNNDITMNNGFQKIIFQAGDKFNINSINAANGYLWTSETGIPDNIWELTLIGPDGTSPTYRTNRATYLGAKSIENTKDKGVLRFRWKLMLSLENEYFVNVFVTMNSSTQLSEWSIEVDSLPTGWIVSDVVFPKLSFKRNENLKFILPTGYGLEHAVVPEKSFYCPYPSGRASVQMLCIVDDNETLYYAIHDANANNKIFRATATETNAVLITTTEVDITWTKNGKFTLPWCTLLGVTSNGWQDAVITWYKPFTYTTEWGRKKFEERKRPQWLLNTDVWLAPGNPTPEEFEKTLKALDFLGANRTACHWYYWHEIPFDTNYPDFLPAKANFVEYVQAIREKGSHVLPYTNGRLWDPFSKSYQAKNGYNELTQKKDGTFYTEIYASKVLNNVICPSSQIYQDIIFDLSLKIQNELGCSGIYYDQIAGSQPYACWNINHKHSLGGGNFWATSYRQLMNRIEESIDEESVTASEQNAECYIDVFDALLMINPPAEVLLIKLVPLFPLIYSDRALLYGGLFYHSNFNSLKSRYQNALSFLWGSQLGWVKPEFMVNPNAKKEADFLKKLVEIRSVNRDLFNGGTFIKDVLPQGDNPILQIPPLAGSTFEDAYAVRGSIWKSNDGKRITLLLVNADDKPHQIKISNTIEQTINERDCLSMDIKESEIQSIF